MHPDPQTILNDYDLRGAVNALRRAGFKCFIFERGTIGAYHGKASYGFAPRRGRFGKEAITRAIEDMRP
jgi:hypothetical protein